MSKRNRDRSRSVSEIIEIGLSTPGSESRVPDEISRVTIFDRSRNWLWLSAVVAFVLLLGLGVMAKNRWLPHTDSLTGKKIGWFGAELPRNAKTAWDPLSLAFASPIPTPQLSKEYIYAGSRLLAVEDKNANAIPPDDLVVWRPSDGNWYIQGGQGSVQTTFNWGMSGDIPTPGDYDGDGKTDFSVFRPDEDGNIYIKKSADGSEYAVPFSTVGVNTPAVADFDGDEKTDLATWQTTGIGNHTWTIKYSSTGTTVTTAFGVTGDKPVPADYDGDGKADVAVWRNSDHTFYWKNSLTGSTQSMSVGTTGDRPACADYDGDGKTDFAVFRDSNGTWYIQRSSDGLLQQTQYGTSNDTLVPNDYDGDGKADLAVWRVATAERNQPGYWYIRQSSKLGAPDETRIEVWGKAADIPVPANYRRH
jgi:hypothetical protein